MSVAERSREVVLVPGLSDKPDEISPVRAGLMEAGLTVRLMAPDWDDRHASFADLAHMIAGRIDASGVGEEATLIGHSFGAVLCCSEAVRREYGRLMLCSLSPVSAEGMELVRSEPVWPDVEKGLRPWNDTRWMRDLGHLDNMLDRLGHAKVPPGKRVVFMGDNELVPRPIRYQAVRAAGLLGVGVTVVPGATHNIDDASYTDAVICTVLR